jgi:DNA primase
MDIHKIWTGITKNVTCTFGTAITEEQKKFLQSASNLILYIDDDSAGHNSVNIFEKFMQHDFRIAVTKGKDPGEAVDKEAELAIKNSISWVDWMLNEINLFDKPKRVSLMKK